MLFSSNAGFGAKIIKPGIASGMHLKERSVMRGLLTTILVELFLATAALPSSTNSQITCFDHVKFANDVRFHNTECLNFQRPSHMELLVEILTNNEDVFSISLAQFSDMNYKNVTRKQLGKIHQAVDRSWVLSGKISAVR